MDTDTSACDVVIPYRISYPDTELLFAIESFRNLPHKDIYLVGDKPRWYKGKHITVDSYKWLMHRPIHNVENKIRAACESPEISENFIMSNDDFYIMQPTNLKYYHRGLLIDHLNGRTRYDQYKKSLQQTYDILRHMGIENPLSYELHVPMLFNKQKRLQISYDMEKYFDKGQMPLMRSIYGNLFVSDSDHMDDVKNIPNFEGSVYLSTNEATFKGSIGNYIKLMLT